MTLKTNKQINPERGILYRTTDLVSTSCRWRGRGEGGTERERRKEGGREGEREDWSRIRDLEQLYVI